MASKASWSVHAAGRPHRGHRGWHTLCRHTQRSAKNTQATHNRLDLREKDRGFEIVDIREKPREYSRESPFENPVEKERSNKPREKVRSDKQDIRGTIHVSLTPTDCDATSDEGI